jgi:hypothetical protein
MTTIHVHGGLCNRLRAILSWRYVCGPLTVAWLPDGQVHHERWSDAFAPLPGVTFIDRKPVSVTSFYEPHPAARGDWQRAYLDLKPLRPAPIIPEPYTAIHVRRTDAHALQTAEKTWHSDEEYMAWALLEPQKDIFLATDNGTTQRKIADYLTRCGKRVHMHEGILEHPDQDLPEVRNTSLLHAWWDIETCARAATFMGSGASSFTDLIETLRRMR